MQNENAMTRSEKRRLQRSYGWGGNKSHRHRDALNAQISWCMTLWSRFAPGKTLEELKNGLPKFFEDNKDEFTPELALELQGRIEKLISEREEKDKEIDNPTSQNGI